MDISITYNSSKILMKHVYHKIITVAKLGDLNLTKALRSNIDD